MKNTVPLPSGHHGFWWETLWYSNCLSSVGEVSLFFLCLQCSLVFRSLTVMWFSVDFGIILFGIHSSSLICRFMYLPNLGSFQSLFLQVRLKTSSFLTPSWHSDGMTVKLFIMIPLAPEALVFGFCSFQFVFLLWFRLTNSYFSTFKFMDLFFFPSILLLTPSLSFYHCIFHF